MKKRRPLAPLTLPPHCTPLSLHSLEKFKQINFHFLFVNVLYSTVMSDSINYDLLLQWYLYDYFRKNNMHETAETFLGEINFPLDPTTVRTVDVKEGFLKEWWRIFYDMYMTQQLSVPDEGEGSTSTMPVEQMMGATQQVDPTLLMHPVMNEQTVSCLQAGFGLNTRNIAMESVNPLTGVEQVPEGISSSLHPRDWLTLTLGQNSANSTGKAVGLSVPAASIVEETASNEIGEESMNKLHSEDGSCNLQGDAGATSEASLPKYKSCGGDAKSSSSNANVGKEDADFSTNVLPGCARAPDNLIVNQVVKVKTEKEW